MSKTYVPRRGCHGACGTGRTGGVCTCRPSRRKGPADKVVMR